METLLEFVKSANGLMWNFLLLVILCGTGIYYTFRLRLGAGVTVGMNPFNLSNT